MSDKQEITQNEQGTGAMYKKSKKQTCMRHCKRFWWAYLLVFICITVLVVCLIIFVAVPKIAQDKVNDAKLEIQGVNVLQTESDAYLMEINSTITTDGSIKAKIDPFVGEMYLEDYEPHVAFATVNFPQTNGDKHQIVNVSQHQNITDMDAFTRFNVWFHNNETLRVTVYGKTKVQPSGLSRKSSVTFKKTVTLNGLNVFNGTSVSDGKIALTADADGNNFNGTATIPNNSVFTLDIGNLTFTNFIENDKVGTLYIDNFTLRPGNNTVPITANMNQSLVINYLTAKPYCTSGVVPFKLLGAADLNHGQNISYFEEALASVNQTVNIDIGSIVSKDLGLTLGCS